MSYMPSHVRGLARNRHTSFRNPCDGLPASCCFLRFAFVKVALKSSPPTRYRWYLLSWITLQHRSLEQTGSDPWTAMSTHSSLSPPAQSPSTLHSCALFATVSAPVFLHLRSYMQTVSAAQARVAMHASFETAVAWPNRPLQWLRFFDGVAM